MITLFLVIVSAASVTSNWMYFGNMDLCETARTQIVKDMDTPKSGPYVAFSSCLQNQAGAQ
jgi:hypothetical protein